MKSLDFVVSFVNQRIFRARKWHLNLASRITRHTKKTTEGEFLNFHVFLTQPTLPANIGQKEPTYQHRKSEQINLKKAWRRQERKATPPMYFFPRPLELRRVSNPNTLLLPVVPHRLARKTSPLHQKYIKHSSSSCTWQPWRLFGF